MPQAKNWKKHTPIYICSYTHFLLITTILFIMIRCEKCDNVIPENDFNISTDIAYCRGCDIQYKYSELNSTVVKIDSFDLNQVPEYISYRREGYDEVITYKRISRTLFFLIPFTAFWSGGSMYGIFIKPIFVGKFVWSEALVGIPFLIGTIILTLIILWCAFGKLVVRISGENSYYGWGMFGYFWKENFDINKVLSVKLKFRGSKENDIPQDAIVLSFSDNKEINFGSFIQSESKEYIAQFLLSKIKRDSH